MMIYQAVIIVLTASKLCLVIEALPLEKSQRKIDTAPLPKTIEETVRDVQELIRSNPKLPRLTRGEIIEILENITAHDKAVSPNKFRDPKALMVVMPYTLKHGSKNVEDYYTKPPITQIIGTTSEKPVTDQIKAESIAKPSVINLVGAEPFTVKPTVPNRKRTRRPTTTTTVKPKPFAVTTYRPKFKQKLSTTTKYPNHKYSTEDQSGIRFDDLPIPNSLKPVASDLNLKTSLKYYKPKPTPPLPMTVYTQKPVSGTTVKIPDQIDTIADGLSPEMRDLLVSFGLLPTADEKPVPEDSTVDNPYKAETDPESFVAFKPLPDTNNGGRDDMEDLLSAFGLGRSSRRAKKLPDSTNTMKLDLDMVPNNLKHVLVDMGIPTMTVPKPKIRQKSTTTTENPVRDQHVFKPKMNQTEDDLKRLSKLLDIIKQIDMLNRTPTDEDLSKIDMNTLNELVDSLNKQTDTKLPLDQRQNFVLNPNNFDSGLSRNEIKRQTSNNTSSTSSTTSSSTVFVSTTTAPAPEAETPSLVDLEASFGGQVPVKTENSFPPERRTGFYYLLDWNSFLEVDDQNDRRVNLKFQPRFGDPKRFLAVNVP